jgi:hypothetical protein
MKRALLSLLLRLAGGLRDGRAVKGSAGIEPGAGEFRVAGPVEAPDWLPEHRRAFVSFLATDAGKTLLQRAAAVQANTAVAACNDSISTTHSAARAAGFGDCLVWLVSLSRSSRATDDSGSEITEQTDTPPIGESALRERMSP